MDDFICPVCGVRGIPAREKMLIRWYGYTLTCRGCGAKLGLGFFESILALVPCFLIVGIGFLIGGRLAAIASIGFGVLVSWWCSTRFVPLVPTCRRPKLQ
jgi:hypothetical protein